MRDRNNNGCVAVKVYHIQPVQGEPDNGAFLLYLQEICSQALILIGDFNYLDVCWGSNTAGCKQSRRLLEDTARQTDQRRIITGPGDHQCRRAH